MSHLLLLFLLVNPIKWLLICSQSILWVKTYNPVNKEVHMTRTRSNKLLILFIIILIFFIFCRKRSGSFRFWRGSTVQPEVKSFEEQERFKLLPEKLRKRYFILQRGCKVVQSLNILRHYQEWWFRMNLFKCPVCKLIGSKSLIETFRIMDHDSYRLCSKNIIVGFWVPYFHSYRILVTIIFGIFLRNYWDKK